MNEKCPPPTQRLTPPTQPGGIDGGVVQEAFSPGSGASADEWYLPALPDGSLRRSRSAWALIQEQVDRRLLAPPPDPTASQALPKAPTKTRR